MMNKNNKLNLLSKPNEVNKLNEVRFNVSKPNEVRFNVSKPNEVRFNRNNVSKFIGRGGKFINRERFPMNRGKDQKVSISMQKFIDMPLISSLDNHKKIFELLNIPQSEDNNLRILDSIPEHNLYLLHFICNTQAVNFVRGIVIQTEPKMRIVCSSFPHTEEYTFTEFISGSSKKLLDVSRKLTFDENTIVNSANEGTILRVFNVDNIGEKGKWFISTHHKIDGTKSQWMGPSFGKMLYEAWFANKKKSWGDDDEEQLTEDELTELSDSFDLYLIKSNCYIFIVSHPDNRLVSKISEPTIKLTVVFTPNGEKFDINHPMKPRLDVKYLNVLPSEKYPFEISTLMSVNNLQEFLNEANNLSWETSTGLMFFNTKSNVCLKIVPDDYFTYRQIRGNEPNLHVRYLQLRSKESHKDLVKLFPERKNFFDKIEKDVKNLVDYLVNCYCNRYYNKVFVKLPQEEYFIVINTFENYNKAMPLEWNISQILKTSNPRQLNKMIDHMNNPITCEEGVDQEESEINPLYE